MGLCWQVNKLPNFEDKIILSDGEFKRNEEDW